MKKNLNVETEGSWCYDEDPASCETYGRLYTWEAAMSACPSGWHLPSDAEWQTLVDFAGGEEAAGAKLKSAVGWNSEGCMEWDTEEEIPCPPTGTDEFGFSALPGGHRLSGGDFRSAGNNGIWWSATENEGNEYSAYGRLMYYGDDNVRRRNESKGRGWSVRCLQN